MSTLTEVIDKYKQSPDRYEALKVNHSGFVRLTFLASVLPALEGLNEGNLKLEDLVELGMDLPSLDVLLSYSIVLYEIRGTYHLASAAKNFFYYLK